MLTNESGMFYAESLKTITPAFTPSQRVFFMPMAWMRAENTQYQPKHCVIAFSESTPLLILRAFLRKITQMTNTIINSLYSQYQQLKTVSGTDKRKMLAVLDKLVNTPTITPEDRKIKFSVGCEYIDKYLYLWETPEKTEFKVIQGGKNGRK